MNIDIPKGIRVFSPKESSLISNIENTITKTFESWGYQEIKLPYFEYFDVHKKGVGKNIANKTFRIIDRYKGEILSLRADFTAQIARYFSSLKHKQIPYRVYYQGTIFRYEIPKGEKFWEKRQSGIELIGLNSLQADIEVLSIAIEALKNLGIKNFQIDLSCVSILYALKEILNLNNEEFGSLVNFVKNKEIFNLEKFVLEKNIKKDLGEFISNIPLYQGKIELIKKLKEKVKNYKKLLEALNYLEELYSKIENFGFSNYITFDLGEVRQFEYYTGIIFEIFIPNHKKPIGQGGRYDKLIGKFNGEFPAIGFAFDTIAIFEYLKNINILTKDENYFAINKGVDENIFFKIINKLRKQGKKVALELIDRSLNSSLDYAFSNNFDKVLVFRVDNGKSSVYIYTRKDNFIVKNIKDLI